MTARSEKRAEIPLKEEVGAERWAALEALLHEALNRPAADRAEYLEAACADAGMRREVDALLQAHEDGGALDTLTDEVMVPMLSSREKRPSSPRPRPPEGKMPSAPSRYSMIARIGGGGMGIVYRARDERLERDVALKFLPAHLSADPAAKKRFLVEARAAASIEHPNICTVHEIGEMDDGQLYIVMGYYDGVTLDQLIARGPLALPEALRIAAEVARGLGKAHDSGIVHRDVKPANIMVTADGIVTILDFGIAKLSDLSFTQTGTVIGTVAYMSPEQAFGESVDNRTDIWSLGVVLFEMVTGTRPFRGPGEQALLFALLTQEPESLLALRPDAQPALDALIRRALAKKPDDRFPTAQEMLAALLALPAVGPPDVVSLASPAPGAAATDSVLTRAGERRQAAVVVTGIADFGQLIERLAPEETDRLTIAFRDAAAEVATHYGGIVNHFAGDDAVMLFGVATAHEDDALRAVRAALALHGRVERLSEATRDRLGVALRMRTGVHTGPVVAQRQRAGDRRFRVTGAPLDVASRLAAFATADEILITADCQRLVTPFIEAMPSAPVMLQSDGAPITTHRVLGESDVQSRIELAERVGLTPLAGRSREVGYLEEQLAAALRSEGRVSVVIGDAGSGKSRLLFELRRRAEAAGTRLVYGRCDAYGGTTPYLPFVQAIRELLGVTAGEDGQPHERVVKSVRALDPSLNEFLPLYLVLLSISSTEHPLPHHLHGEHLQAAMLEALAALVSLQARQEPMVLLLEDWHWADEASRAALDRISEIAPAYPLLVVVSSRPDIDWKADENRTLVHLGPLSFAASVEIVRSVFGADEIAPDLAQQLHERTGGNPFFLEETCQALREEGAVVVRSGQAVAAADSGGVQFPETVQAVIRTRLDRLDPETRDTLRMAAVIGREFSRPVLEALPGANRDVVGALEQLRSAGLIQQIGVVPEPVYRFKHVLTQEVAYDTLLEHQRKALHAAVGRIIVERYGDRLDEHLERVAHHFSRGHEWRDAVRYGIRAADRAKALSHFGDALGTLDQVQEWLKNLRDDAEHRDLLADVYLRQERLCETLGQRARQLKLVGELIALLAPVGGSARLAEAYLRQGDVFTLLRRFDAADRALGTSILLSRELGDRPGERNALRSMGLLRSHEGRAAEAIAIIEQALALDLELGEKTAAAADVASLGNILRNMGRYEEALEALEQALQYLTPDEEPTKWCAVTIVIASVHRDLGDTEAALRHLERAREMAIERRLPILASFSLPTIAHIKLEQGRVEESLATYREAIDLSRRARHGDGLAQTLRAVGEVLFGLGRCYEAVPNLQEAAELFGQLEDRETQTMIWQRTAMAHERCDQFAEAEEVWKRVRERCAEDDDNMGETLALEGLARCARRRGVRSVAMEEYETALTHAIHAGQREREVTLRNTLGLLRWEDGAFTEALRHYEAALRLCRELEDRVHEGLILNSLGATLHRLRRYDEARTSLEEAARVNRETGQRQLEAHSEAVLGQVLLVLGRPREARQAIERSLAIRPELGDRRGEGWMLEHLARAYLAEGRQEDALIARDAACAIAVEVKDPALDAALGKLADMSAETPDQED